MQGSNRIFDSFRHFINFALFSDVLVTDNSIDGSFHGGEVLVVILLQSVCFGNGCINLCVISILVLQGSNRIFDRFRHRIYLCLFCKALSSNHRIDCSLHSRKVFILVLVQGICLGNGRIYATIISRTIEFRIITNLRKRIAQ